MARRLAATIHLWRTILRINMAAGSLLAIGAVIFVTALQPDGPMVFIGLGLGAVGAFHAWISASALHRLHWRWVVPSEE